MALTDIAIRNAKARETQYKLSDSAGLYLLVQTNGSKYWRLKYRFASKEKTLSIGVYPVVSLAQAREKCSEAKRHLVNNVDPSQSKKEEKLKNTLNTENSFKIIAVQWHNNKKQS